MDMWYLNSCVHFDSAVCLVVICWCYRYWRPHSQYFGTKGHGVSCLGNFIYTIVIANNSCYRDYVCGHSVCLCICLYCNI